MIEAAFSKMQQVLEKSFEPRRQDAKIVPLIDSFQEKIINIIPNPDQIFNIEEISIDLSRMTAVSELQTISTVLADKFNQITMNDISGLFSNFVLELEEFQTYPES